jgi:hypothetical protein
LLSGCFTDPDTFYSFRGAVETASRAPAAGAEVRLFVERDTRHVGRCRGALARTFVTDADGGYFTEALARELFDPARGPRGACVHLETDFDGGVKAWTELGFVDGTQLALPRLSEWSPSPRLDGGWLTFQPFSDDLGSLYGRPRAGHRVSLTSNGALGWFASDTSGRDGGAFGALFLGEAEVEDFDLELELDAYRTEPVPALGVSSLPPTDIERVTMAHGPTSLTVRGTSVPASRGAACPALGVPCPLTDGSLASNAFASGLASVSLELPRSIAPGRIVLRGLASPGGAAVLVTLDGAPLSTLADPFDLASFGLDSLGFDGAPLVLAFDAPAGVAPSSRVMLEFSPPLTQLSELSVFERVGP